MPANAVEITAEFAAITYEITIAATENGTVTADKTKAAEGETVTLTITPAQGFELVALNFNGEALDGNTFSMPANAVEITAEFIDLRVNGETYGAVNDYKSGKGIDMTYDRGETPYVAFNGEGTQMGYLKDTATNRLYYQAEYNIIGLKNGEQYPKFGMYTHNETTSVFFYVDMTTSLTATYVGYVYVRNGSWDWNNSVSVKVDGMTFTGDDRVTLSMQRDGEALIFFVNGKYALSALHSEMGDAASVYGAFGFNTEMNVYATALDTSEEKASLLRTLVPKIGYAKNGVGYCLNDYIYDPEADTISVNHANSNVRAIATYYHDGEPVYREAYAMQGTVRMYNTKTSGGQASKVEFQVGRNTSNFYKILVYRYGTTNNSIYVEGANQQDGGNIILYRVKNNTLPSDADYTAEYKVIYDHGVVYFVLDNEVQLIYETGWKEAGYSFGVLQYADVTWTCDFTVDEDEIANIVSKYKTDYLAYKNAEALSDDQNLLSGASVKVTEGTYFRTGGSLIAGDTYVNGKACVTVKHGDDVLVEYALKKTTASKWYVEKTVGGEAEIILAPSAITASVMNYEVAISSNKLAFMLNGKVRDVIDGEFDGASVHASTTNAKARLHLTYKKDFATDEEASAYIASAPEYAYYSNYASRINSLYNEYVASGDSVTGGVLLLGSSTIDFWDHWAEHLSLIDKKTGYNLGIGGTTSEDFLFAYEKHVTPFDPSCVIIFGGGNDIGVNGARGVDTARRLAQYIDRIHHDFENASIYYIYSMPCPSAYGNGVWKNVEYLYLINAMKAYCDARDFVVGIDTFDVLTENDDPIFELFRADGIHLTDHGYEVWAEELLKHITFPENLGKRYLTSEFAAVESGWYEFEKIVTLDMTGTEYDGNEGLTLSVTGESGNAVPVTREGNLFTFAMPTENATLTAVVSAKYANRLLIDNGAMINGVFTSFGVEESENGIPEHYAYQKVSELLPEEIKTNQYLVGYAVSSDNGTTFGSIVADIDDLYVGEGDVVKACFAMMGSAVSGNSVLQSGKAQFDALANSVTLGYDGNTASTRLWGSVYNGGELYSGKEFTVSMHVSMTKPAANTNQVIEIQIGCMPAVNVFRGRKVFLRFESNATMLKRQYTDSLTTGYNAGLAKTDTGITVASNAVLTMIEFDVTVKVTSTGFTITVVNSDNAEQVYEETYVFSDSKYEWDNVGLSIASVQVGKVTFSDITFTSNEE